MSDKVKLNAAALLTAASALGVVAVPVAAQAQTPTVAKTAKLTPKLTQVSAKGSEAQLRSQIASLSKTDALKGAILQSALDNAKGRPGFNPAAISISFGLKW